MKILHTVEFYEPFRGGAEEVVRQISERLSKRGHEVTVATSYHPDRRDFVLNGVKIEQFRVKGNMVKGLKGDVALFENFVRDGNFDIIMNYAAQSWPTDITFLNLDKIKAKKILLPMGYSKITNPAYRDYFAQLPLYLKKYDKLAYTSPDYQDKKFGDAHGMADRSVIIRNGASHEEFRGTPVSFRSRYGIESKYLFISVANHYFSKGHEFVIRAVKMLKNKDFTLVIIGEPPNIHSWYSCYPCCRLHALFSGRIRVMRNVPRDLVVAGYLEADAFLFGSRIECAPLVMYESFASRTPFITRDVGNIRDHSNLVRIVNTPREMAAELTGLMENPRYYGEIAEKAYEEFARFYTWEKIAGQFEELYETAMKG